MFEGPGRIRVAEKGLEELRKYCDTMIVIPNQNLFKVANEKTTFPDAFQNGRQCFDARCKRNYRFNC